MIKKNSKKLQKKIFTEKYTYNIANFHPVDEFICSNCGIHLADWTRIVVDEDHDNDEYHQEYAFNFCPNCGAEIIDDEEYGNS